MARFEDRIVVWPALMRELRGRSREPGLTLIAQVAVMIRGRISVLPEQRRELVWRLDDGSLCGPRSWQIWNRPCWDWSIALARLDLEQEARGKIIRTTLGWIPAGRWCIGQAKKDLKEALLDTLFEIAGQGGREDD